MTALTYLSNPDNRGQMLLCALIVGLAIDVVRRSVNLWKGIRDARANREQAFTPRGADTAGDDFAISGTDSDCRTGDLARLVNEAARGEGR